MLDDAEQNDSYWTGVLGPVYDRVIQGADVYLAGVNELLIPGVNVTLREAAGVTGWVGVVDADLTPYIDFKLELRLPDGTADCGIMFTIGGEIFGRTLIRGTGPMPGDTPKIRSRPRVTPKPRELG
jgi:hypothetical protein